MDDVDADVVAEDAVLGMMERRRRTRRNMVGG